MAEKRLYDKYKKIVKDFIISKYSVNYDIDDDVSEILIKIFLSLKSFDAKKSKFKSWVISITKNYMIDKWRCGAVTCLSINNITFTTNIDDNKLFIANNSNNITSTNFSASCQFENSNTLDFISTQLSPGDFTLLDMKYIQGYSYNEIGQEFQITSNTVSNKINYIKTKLKKNIPEDIFE